MLPCGSKPAEAQRLGEGFGKPGLFGAVLLALWRHMLAEVLQIIRRIISAVQDSMGQYEDHSAFTLPGLYRVISVRLCHSLRSCPSILFKHGMAECSQFPARLSAAWCLLSQG